MIILASQSAARRTLLAGAGIEFRSVVPALDEEQVKAEHVTQAPAVLAATLARAKAQATSYAHRNQMVLAADQTLEADGQCLHKTHSLAEARYQLQVLRGKSHFLHSAIAVTRNHDLLFQHVATAKLTMRNFSDTFLDHYLDTVDPGIAKSLGGYQLEGLGVQLFEAIEGDYFTILGLPLVPLLAFLRQSGEVET